MTPVDLGKSHSIAFSAKGDLLAVLSKDLCVWSVPIGKRILRVHPLSHPCYASFSPNNGNLAVKNTSGKIVVISTESGKTIVDFKNDLDGEGSNLVYSSCGKYVVDGTWAGALYVRCATSGKTEFVHEFPGEMIYGLKRFMSNNCWCVMHVPKSVRNHKPLPSYFSIWEWPFRKGKHQVMNKEVPFSRSFAVSPTDDLVAVVHGSRSQSLSVFNLADGTCACTVRVHIGGTGSAVAWSSDGRYIGSVQSDMVVIYEYPRLVEFQRTPLHYASDVAFAPKANLVAVGSWKAGCLLPLCGI